MEAAERPETALHRVLSLLKIRTIVCVDDSYEATGDPASIIGWLAEAVAAGDTEFLGRLSPLFGGLSVEAPEDVWSAEIREWWQTASVDDRRRIGLEAAAVLGRLDEADRGAMQRLADLLGGDQGGVRLLELAPAEWKERAARIFGQATEDERLFCLFDQDLTASGLGPDGGMNLLAANIATYGAQSEGKAYFGLLSQKFGIGEEEHRWRDLAEEYPSLLARFLPIAKERLDDPLEFAHGVKLAVIIASHERLKEAVERISQESREEALNGLHDLTVWDFDHMVLQSSEYEGVWEVETLFRVYGIFERQARRRRALQDHSAFDALTGLIRSVRLVETHPGTSVSPQVRSVRRAELFESEEFNRFMLPTELGDFFARGKEQFVLIAQPCDLIVRSDGSRRLVAGTLVPIRSYKTARRNTEMYPGCLYFAETEDGRFWHFDFRGAVEVSLDVLDMAVYREDGECRFRASESAPSGAFVPWKLRHQALCKRLSALEGPIQRTLDALGAAGTTDNERRQVVAQMLSGFCLVPGFLNAAYVGGEFLFGLKRVGRYLVPASTDLLARYEAFRARAALEHDFARPTQAQQE